ncbi:MAG: peptide deformylase [Candidatus Falkowbacteria bacterium]
MPKLLNIITHPNDILRKKCVEIKKVDEQTRQLILDMEKTMLEKDGIGLAAPQIGQNINLILINTKDGPIHMINPKITRKSWFKSIEEEGCLSLPTIFGKVKRSKKIRVIYNDKNNSRHKLKAEGMFARVVQHEVDHLNGVLFIDHIKDKDLPEGIKK